MSYVPTAAFRKDDISAEKVFYRLYVKRVKGKKFEWFGEFKSVEEAKDRFEGVFGSRQGYLGIAAESALYVIKKVVVRYEEEICAKSMLKSIEDRLPELKGMFS
jgi:hypothetical protein